jgi:hypothetical protein
MKIKPSLLFLIIVAIISACNGFDPQEYVPGLFTPTSVPSQVESTPSSIPLTPTMLSSTPEPVAITTVCTNIPGGKLNVRFTPSESGEVRGYLIESEKVTTSGESEEMNGTVWIKLSYPIEGWVNGHYLCEDANE